MLSIGTPDRNTVLECLKKHPNGITVTELMRKEPDLSFDMYTPQTIIGMLTDMKVSGEVKREVKVINPKKKFYSCWHYRRW